MSNEDAKERLRETLERLKTEKQAEKPKGGLVADPIHQMADRMRDLEYRIEELESRVRQLDNELMMYRPLG